MKKTNKVLHILILILIILAPYNIYSKNKSNDLINEKNSNNELSGNNKDYNNKDKKNYYYNENFNDDADYDDEQNFNYSGDWPAIGIRAEDLKKFQKNSIIRKWEAKTQMLCKKIKLMYLSIFNFKDEINKAVDNISNGRGIQFFIETFLILFTLVSFCFAIEYTFRRLLINVHKQLILAPEPGLLSMIIRLFSLTFFKILYLAVFSITGGILYLIFFRDQGYRGYYLCTFFTIIVSVRMISIISEFILSPKIPGLRLLPLQNNEAIYLYKWFMSIASFCPVMAQIIITLKTAGVSDELFLLLFSLTGFIPTIMIIIMIFQQKETVAIAIRNENNMDGHYEKSVRAIFAEVWHIAAAIYAIIIYIVWEIALLLTGHDLVFSYIMSYVSIPFFLAADRVSWRLCCVAFSHKKIPSNLLYSLNPSDTSRLEDAIDSKSKKYIKMLQRFIRLFLLILLMLWLKDIWGLSHAFERGFIKAGLSILITVIITNIIWEFTKTIIDYKIQQEKTESNSEIKYFASSRKSTLLTILRKVILSLLFVVSSLIILSSIGLDIGPILAGAGVIGLTLGFGAQTLVKDIFSGIFFLIDDAFRIGDYVDTGKECGTVEQISLRAIILRHQRGMIFTIPFGELTSIVNYSRDWIITYIDFFVPYKTNINELETIIENISNDLNQSSYFSTKLLEPLCFMGVRKLEDSAMLIRVSFKSKPGEQFNLRKELHKRIQQSFEENNIYFGNKKISIQFLDKDEISNSKLNQFGNKNQLDNNSIHKSDHYSNINNNNNDDNYSKNFSINNNNDYQKNLANSNTYFEDL